ncbi:MAG: cache domain-containing protein [Anaerolineae bacterium]|nr:cache domain-containing protein [Anaerolineae bacterium]MDW8067784.1 cache domain-containing protein [Anaerolineae bacterium]
MRAFFLGLLGGQLRIVLTVSFALIAALTVGLNALVVSHVIHEYLASAEAERVARDMKLAETFYQLKLDEVAAISHRLVLDQWVVENFAAAARGDPQAIQIIDRQITNKIIVLALGGTHLIAVLDAQGNLVVGKVLWPEGSLSSTLTRGHLGDLPIVRTVLETGRPQAATEVIPKEFLAQVGLDNQAFIPLLETPLAAPEPFDPREGTAGLALVGVSPLRDPSGQLMGAVLSAYMFNNDYTLVDRIKEVAGIDTVTIFLGDLRVSTNVTDEAGRRAIGTRLSQAVRQVVLEEKREYVGRAFVVKEWYITRYEPLWDHQGNVVGILYVGAREAAFRGLVQSFNQRVALIAIICILLASIIAVPISYVITRPVSELVEAHRRLAAGDMAVRVLTYGDGELATLGRSFNSMAETLCRTQQELLHKEKLASMGQLAAGVAHELNNPLGTIMLFADALHRELPPDDPHRSDLEMILKEANRAKKIVADLLNFARQQEVLAQETDLHTLLDQSVESVRHQPTFAGVEIIRCYDPRVRIIQADPAQLQQVFVNLLNNAAEAIEGPGTITIATRCLNGQVEISITDTGCGIPEEHMDKLFTPFFTTKPPGKGTGLGLSIVYGIVKMHRGQITVQSQVGKGTTFTLTLPVRWVGETGRPLPGPQGAIIG